MSGERRPRRTLLAWASVLCALLLSVSGAVDAASSGDVVINEVAWMGTAASPSDEWVELYNTTDQAIDLQGWTLAADDGSPDPTLDGTIPANGFYLLERTSEQTVSDVDADQIYTGNLSNSGESLTLKDASGDVISRANADGGDWPAGDNGNHATMERIDPSASGEDDNWATNDGSAQNGQDANGTAIHGTPKAVNSVTPTNQAPTCADVSLSVDEGSPGSVAPNCSDADDEPLSYAIADPPPHGSANVQNGTLHYSPDANYVGSDSFTYRADDGQATSNPATVEVSVTAVATAGDGDPDGDGNVDALDARICLQIAQGVGSHTSEQQLACDVDGDGSVGRDDAEQTARATLGLASVLGAARWLAALTLLGLALPLALRTSGRMGRLLATLPGLLGLSLVMTGCPGLIPALPDDAIGVKATVSSEVVLVEVQNMPHGGVAALEIEAGGLTFDADAVRVTSVQPTEGWTVLACEIDNGTGEVRLVAVRARGGTADGRILTLALEPKPGFSRGAADVAWNASELVLGDATNAQIEDFQTGTQP